MTTPPDLESTQNPLVELIELLSDPRVDVRQQATALVCSLSASELESEQLIEGGVIPPLCRLTSDVRPVAEDAIKSLINLTASDPQAIELAVTHDIVSRLQNQLTSNEWTLRDLSLMLLANVSLSMAGAESLVDRQVFLQTLTTWFMQLGPEPSGVSDAGEPQWDDEVQYVANVFANVTQLKAGRDFLLQKRAGETLIELLVSQFHSPNVVRRRGLANMVKNLCFETHLHAYLMTELDVLNLILFRLAGPEDLSDDDREGMNPLITRLGRRKTRERDTVVRLALVDALLLLCVSQKGRVVLRQAKAYPIIRDAHVVEHDDVISGQMYQLVDYLMRDEEGEEPDWNDIRAKAYSEEAREEKSGQEQPERELEETEDPRRPKLKKNPPPKVIVQASARSTHSKGEDEVAEEDISEELAQGLADLICSSSDEEED